MKDEKKQVKEKEMENSQGVSRRQFLISTGVVAAGLSAFQLSEFLNAPHVKAAGGTAHPDRKHRTFVRTLCRFRPGRDGRGHDGQ